MIPLACWWGAGDRNTIKKPGHREENAFFIGSQRRRPHRLGTSVDKTVRVRGRLKRGRFQAVWTLPVLQNEDCGQIHTHIHSTAISTLWAPRSCPSPPSRVGHVCPRLAPISQTHLVGVTWQIWGCNHQSVVSRHAQARVVCGARNWAPHFCCRVERFCELSKPRVLSGC